MKYEEWLETIEKIKKTNVNQVLLEKLENEELNPNINTMLIPKLEELIMIKFELAVNRIKSELELAFSDEEYLDYILVSFKKEINYIMELVKLKQIPSDKKVLLTYKIVEGARSTYDALAKEADLMDPTGVLGMTIKNNRIKWSEER